MGIYNRMAFFSTLLGKRITGGGCPFIVTLATTFRCNLNCGYCYGTYYKRNDKEFTNQELLGLIDGLAKLGTRWITLSGGEPLIRDDIGEIIKRIKERGMDCGMNTNGTLIPRRLKELKCIDRITVSLDGPKEMNDANRGEGSFEKIIAGIDAALENGIKAYIVSVITRYNYEAVDWLVEFAGKRGIQVEFNLLFHQSEGKHDSDRFMAENTALRKAARRIAELKAKGGPIKFSAYVYRNVANWPDYKIRLIMGNAPDFEFIRCYAGRFLAFIDVDGKVYPCVQLIDVFDALDFRKVGIEQAWKHCINHSCRACYFPCFNEFSAIMNLDLRAIREQVVSTFKQQ